MNNKLITIIIATYNASKTIKKCLNSIVSQMTSDCELIIIDGSSDDDTVKIVKSYGNEINFFISEPDLGIYDAWNKGIIRSNGSWIMFLGADDILLPNAIKSYLDILINNNKINELDYICARNEYVDKNGKLIMILGKAANWHNMRKMNVAAHVGSLHSKDRLFNEVGLYDLKFKICADYELLLRKGEKLKFMFVDTIISRMYTGGMSFKYRAVLEIYRIRKLRRTVSKFMNVIFLIYDLFLFTTFSFRKKLI